VSQQDWRHSTVWNVNRYHFSRLCLIFHINHVQNYRNLNRAPYPSEQVLRIFNSMEYQIDASTATFKLHQLLCIAGPHPGRVRSKTEYPHTHLNQCAAR
jgi:hypothetical protein